MNRLVIIGNGFDLAHGLPTGYKDFIKHFWSCVTTKFTTDYYRELIEINENYTGFFRYGEIVDLESFLNNLKDYCTEYKYRFNVNSHVYYSVDYLDDKKILFKFKSEFFKLICLKDLKNWVDIETEYYKSLTNIAKLKETPEEEKYSQVKILNQHFQIIKNLLFSYLREEVCNKYEFEIEDSNEIVKYFKGEMESFETVDSYSTLFLSFNYTPLARIYSERLNSLLIKSAVNYIHGEIGNPENSEIVFGYGDDKDEYYKLLKSYSSSNDFLENIKPFEYKNNDNFENLLEFLDKSKYNVYLIGHSCGLSDKYLLNQIFENDNCESIKVLYRVYKDGKDDFRNKTMDISRHFENDRLSIARIVNRKKSKSIPQDIRFRMRQADFDFQFKLKNDPPS